MLTVLDTSLLIDCSGFDTDQPTAISVISIAELEFGVLQAGDDERRAHRLARLTEVLHIFEPLPVDHSVARSYAELAALTVRAGLQPRIRSMDLLIAATAHSNRARLATRNGSDFRHLAGVLDIVEV